MKRRTFLGLVGASSVLISLPVVGKKIKSRDYALVRFHEQRTSEHYPEDVYLSMNGCSLCIKRGVEVILPWNLLEVAAHCPDAYSYDLIAYVSEAEYKLQMEEANRQVSEARKGMA